MRLGVSCIRLRVSRMGLRGLKYETQGLTHDTQGSPPPHPRPPTVQSRPMLRRTLLVISLLALLVVCIKPRMLQIVFIDREAAAREMNGSPDRLWPLYPRFLEGVRAHTQPGDTIAIIAPGIAWDNGYSYAYYRASYFLTGRHCLPLLNPEHEQLAQNFRAA